MITLLTNITQLVAKVSKKEDYKSKKLLFTTENAAEG